MPEHVPSHDLFAIAPFYRSNADLSSAAVTTPDGPLADSLTFQALGAPSKVSPAKCSGGARPQPRSSGPWSRLATSPRRGRAAGSEGFISSRLKMRDKFRSEVTRLKQTMNPA